MTRSNDVRLWPTCDERSQDFLEGRSSENVRK